jgi:hypothetical protein
VVDLPPAEEEEEAPLEAPRPAQDAFGALLAGAPEPSAAPEEDDDDAFEAMMVSAASSAAEAGYPDEEEEAPPALSQTGEHRRLARLALAKAPSGEVSALAARAVGEELDADLLADAIVAASQDQSLDAGPAWPEEAAAPPRAQSSVEMFHSGDESQDDDIDIDLEALAPPPRLEPLASLQPSKGPTLSAMPRQEIASTTNSSASIRIQPTGELEGLLGRLQGRDPLDDDGDERGGELQLASAALPPLPAAPSPSPAAFDEEDDPSLEGLVSAARRGFTAQVPAVQEEAPPDAILDSLLGDAPPPPPPRPSGQLPGVPFVQPIQPFAEATQEKPKKGFLSRLFNRD